MIKNLTAAAADDDNPVSVVSIVGMGGPGKTTLASTIYNSDHVLDHFHFRSWVHASQTSDVKDLTNRILDSVSASAGVRKHHPHTANLDRLQTLLRDILTTKRFLLVLDDVWTEDPAIWETILPFLLSGLPGSKILVTTRSLKVAAAMGVRDKDQLLLPLLPDDVHWALFKMFAFGSQDPGNFPAM